MSQEILVPPKPKGPYATTHRVGNALYLSGQGSIDPSTGDVIPGDVHAQTTQTLTNIEALLQSEGFNVGDLAQLTCYLVDIEEWGAMNLAYANYLGERANPVRTTVGVAALPFGIRIEITAVAHKKDA